MSELNGIHEMKKGDLAYFIIRGEGHTNITELYHPHRRYIKKELLYHFPWYQVDYIMEMFDKRGPDIHGFVVDVKKFKETWPDIEKEKT